MFNLLYDVIAHYQNRARITMTVLASSTLAFIVINSNFLIFICSSPPAPSGIGIMIMPALKLDCLFLKQSFCLIHKHSTEAFETQTLQIILNTKSKALS